MVGAKRGLHIGIILDGNRRYAKKLKMQPWKGHEHGAHKVKEIMGWCKDFNIRTLTLYTFSIENFDRPKKEVDALFQIFRKNISQLLDDQRIDRDRIRVKFIGKLELFPTDIQESMRNVMERTAKYDKYEINFAMGYGGRAEIVDAFKKICKLIQESKISIDQVDEDLLTDNMYLSDSPDLIIRPGGEKRVSNFLIWQSYYSEWYFSDKLWPEFTKEDLKKAILEFRRRERRFGR